jgi:hypothetical protein
LGKRTGRGVHYFQEVREGSGERLGWKGVQYPVPVEGHGERWLLALGVKGETGIASHSQVFKGLP